MRSLHFNDNAALDYTDKYLKLQPLIHHLQKKFMEHFVPTQNTSHDEAMVKYFGKHTCKQAIRNKPIRFGYKLWCQNTSSGYLIPFDPFQGKTYKGNIEKIQFGRCLETVLHLLAQFSKDKAHLLYCLCFDNLFTTISLMEELKRPGYKCVGKTRSNRVTKECPLMNVKKMDSKSCGYYDPATVQSNSADITLRGAGFFLPGGQN